jgi:hypothetical protein
MSESQLLDKAIKESMKESVADYSTTPEQWDSPITPTQPVAPSTPPKRKGRFSLYKNN